MFDRRTQKTSFYGRLRSCCERVDFSYGLCCTVPCCLSEGHKKKLLSMEDFGLAVRELTFLMDCAALFLDV